MNELIHYLLNLAFDCGISYSLVTKDKSYQSISLPDQSFMVINLNCFNHYELPFIIGHEIGHIMNENDGKFKYTYGKVITSEEHAADLYSLNTIFDYATKQYSSYEEPIQFMQQYGIPNRMFDDTVDLFRNNNDLLF
ncbi:hypothetical protein OZX56_05505 [Lactobacillus sp. ESL0684]|uniref:hypothetical protein n=1 Tax=Lactobacillus sp. ESL0684 TaxID=2983213 RepID=UPI0023F85052|nr:hypothetical protein [Lactobacillus sp. ESL0684]WEV43005.1 hypothetical protein OZX56_05505 [Lactobacillus sp. ESL0684]